MNNITLYVNNINCSKKISITIQAELSNDSQSIKERVADEIGVHSCLFRLIHNGIELTNDNNIKDEDTLQYLMKLNPDKDILTWINENHDIFGNTRSIDEIWGIEFENGKLIYLESENGSNGVDLPDIFGELKHLKNLCLSYTIIRNEIPNFIFNLTNLVELHIEKCELSGEIPNDIGKLVNLTSLYLNNNNLTGEIPKEIAMLKNLEVLSLGFNRLEGYIPKCICNLQKLKSVDLCNNLLSGPILTEFGKLKKLEELYCSSNNLSGPIPTEFSKLENITHLMFNDNKLTGNVPTELLDLLTNNHNVIIKLINNKFEKGFLEKKLWKDGIYCYCIKPFYAGKFML